MILSIIDLCALSLITYVLYINNKDQFYIEGEGIKILIFLTQKTFSKMTSCSKMN